MHHRNCYLVFRVYEHTPARALKFDLDVDATIDQARFEAVRERKPETLRAFVAWLFCTVFLPRITAWVFFYLPLLVAVYSAQSEYVD